MIEQPLDARLQARWRINSSEGNGQIPEPMVEEGLHLVVLAAITLDQSTYGTTIGRQLTNPIVRRDRNTVGRQDLFVDEIEQSIESLARSLKTSAAKDDDE
jgi:hypothetical protein